MAERGLEGRGKTVNQRVSVAQSCFVARRVSMATAGGTGSNAIGVDDKQRDGFEPMKRLVRWRAWSWCFRAVAVEVAR